MFELYIFCVTESEFLLCHFDLWAHLIFISDGKTKGLNDNRVSRSG